MKPKDHNDTTWKNKMETKQNKGTNVNNCIKKTFSLIYLPFIYNAHITLGTDDYYIQLYNLELDNTIILID